MRYTQELEPESSVFKSQLCLHSLKNLFYWSIVSLQCYVDFCLDSFFAFTCSILSKTVTTSYLSLYSQLLGNNWCWTLNEWMSLFNFSLYSWYIGIALLIYNTVLVTGVQQSESVMHSFLESFPIQAITEYWVGSPVPYSRSLLVISFICSCVYMSIPTSQFIPPPALSPPSNHKFIFSVTLFLCCK